MRSLIIIEAILIIALVTGVMIADLSLLRAGQILIGFGLISLVIGILAALRWPALRGDVSDLSPITRSDILGAGENGHLDENERPSRLFLVAVFVIAIINLAAGIMLVILKA